MPHKVWESIRDLARQLESEFPTRARLRALARDLHRRSYETTEAALQETEYVYLSLRELLALAGEDRIPFGKESDKLP